jgi:hypothetical protein
MQILFDLDHGLADAHAVEIEHESEGTEKTQHAKTDARGSGVCGRGAGFNGSIG